MPALSDQQHRSLAFWGMALMVIGLPLSLMLVSIGQFVLAGNWLLEGNYKKRLVQFFTDPLCLVITSIYLLFLLGMIHTQNVEQGLNELRIKLPILIVPLMLFTTKLPSRKRIQDLFMLFVVACVAGSIIGFLKYMGITGEEVVNKRHLSVFTSHIRFGLMIVFSFFILAYHWVINRKECSITEKVLTLVVMAWLFYFLILL